MSPSWPWKDRTDSPVRASRMSTIPEPSGPSVTKTLPSGLQSSRPPTPGTRSSMREPVTAAVEGLLGLREAPPPSPERERSTAARASRMLRSGSTSRLALAAAASSRAVAIWPASSARSRWLTATKPVMSAPTRKMAVAVSRARRRRFWRAWWRARSSAACCSVSARARLASRKARSVGVRSGRGSLAPVEGLGKAGTAVELAVGAAHRVPGVGGAGDVAQDALALDVLVEPALQAGPGPGERLVGELDDAVVAGDKPGADQQLDELVVGGVGRHGPAGHPAAHRLPVGARRDQAQQQVAYQRAPVGGTWS